MITLSALITACPAPVDSSGDITDALFWIDLVEVWAEEQNESDLPNRMKIINMCYLYTPEIYVGTNSSDYDGVNNLLMHVRSALTAVQTMNEHTTNGGSGT